MFKKYEKIWLNNEPGLFITIQENNICQVLLYCDGHWYDRFCQLDQLKKRYIDISTFIYEHRQITLDYSRID